MEFVPDKPDAMATAVPYCNRNADAFVGGRIRIATGHMAGHSELLRQFIFTHEIGHLLGLDHNDGQRACTSVMPPSADEWTICADGKGPYPDDVAGVLAVWRPDATPGWPAGSRITFDRNPYYHLEATRTWLSGRFNGITFTAPGTDGRWDWTFVEDKADDGWGWIVNSATGMCIKRTSGASHVHMGWCEGDEALWAVNISEGGLVQILGNAVENCFGIKMGDDIGRRHWTDSMDCLDRRALLQIVKVTSPRTKRSLPEAETVGGPIVGAGSDRCLTAQGGPYTAGSQVAIFSCAGTAAQKWRFDPVAGGYVISVFNPVGDIDDSDQGSAESLSPAMCLSGSGETVATSACRLTAAMTWTVGADGTLRNQAAGTCLNVRGGATGDDSRLMLYPCATTSNMVWSEPEALTSDTVSLAPVSSAGGVLTTAAAPGGNADARIRTVVSKNAGQDTARFVWEEVPGTYGGLLRNLGTGTCLRWKANSTQAVLDEACDGADSSYRWGPTKTAKGVWKLQSQYTGECLDLFGGNDTENAVIGTYSCNGGSNQLWRAVPNATVWPTGTHTPGKVPDIALFGTATQSSTLDPISSGPEKGNDGDTGNQSIARTTGSDAYPWWQLDFGKSTPIDVVTVMHPTDRPHLSFLDYYILASDNPIPNTNPASLTTGGIKNIHIHTAWAPQTTVKLDGSYRYVRIAYDWSEQITLAEVIVTPRKS